jgi:hypothetical protein
MTFSPSQFTPTPWDSAEDKAFFANHFVRFIRSACEEKYFTAKFYRRLSSTFGHIAHHDRDGFWSEFFTSFSDMVRFLEAILHHPCHGDPAWTYCDVELALQEWLQADETLQRYRFVLALETKAREGDDNERLQQELR